MPTLHPCGGKSVTSTVASRESGVASADGLAVPFSNSQAAMANQITEFDFDPAGGDNEYIHYYTSVYTRSPVFLEYLSTYTVVDPHGPYDCCPLGP